MAPAISTPVGPAPLGVVPACLGLFEGTEDAAADAGGVVDLLEAGGDPLPFVMAEVRVPRAGGEHQIVVGDFAVLELHQPALLVDARHLAQDHALVAGAAQDGADRRGDLRRRQAGGRDLIEQRLEEVVVAPVDDGDVGCGAGQGVRAAQPAKARADDHDVRPGHGGTPSGQCYARPNRLKAMTRSIDNVPAPRVKT
jgi:hypothetical protein